MISAIRCSCDMQCLGRRTKYSNAHKTVQQFDTIGRYTGILIHFLCVLKLGWIFALFSRVRQSRLNKSMNQFDSANLPTSRRGFATGSFHGKPSWFVEMSSSILGTYAYFAKHSLHVFCPQCNLPLRRC